MNTEQIKTRLIKAFGERPIAFIQAIRFIYLLYTKSKPDPEVALLPVLLKEGDIAIDVGANGADWTYRLHHNIGENGLVYAFEADPYYALATGLAINIMRLKGVCLFHFGLSERNEEVPLIVYDEKGSRLSGLSYIDRNADKASSNIKIVKLRQLDSLTKDYPKLSKVNFIKCDVEGFELNVFRGAIETIEHSRPFIVLEVGNFEMQGYSAKSVYEFFTGRNYISFAMIGENILARTNEMLEHNKAISKNRLMLPTEKIMALKSSIKFV